MSEPATSKFDPVALLRAGSKHVALWAAIGFAVGLGVAFLLPKWYVAHVSVVAVPPPRGSVPMLGSSSTGLAAALDLPVDISMGPSDVERISAVFHSTVVTDAIIAKFDLQKRYREKYIEDTRKELWNLCVTKVEKKPALVTLSCEDKSPAVAKAMTEYFAEVGNETFRRVSKSSAGEERRFLEKRVVEARADMVQASQRLKEFQEKHRVIDLPEQSKAVVAAMAQLRAELVSKEIQLSYLNSFSSGDEATASQARRHITVLQAKLRTMEESQGTAPEKEELGAKPKPASKAPPGKKNGTGMFPPAMDVPQLRFELEQLFREQKLQEVLFLMLTQRYEQARVSEARDTSTFQVLDQPTLPTKKVRPKRLVVSLLGLLAGGLLAVGGLLGPPWWRTRPLSGGRRLGWRRRAPGACAPDAEGPLAGCG